MKIINQILVKTLYSLIISYIIVTVFIIIVGYADFLRSFILVAMFHLLVILISLLEFISKSKKVFKYIPHLILSLLFLFWALMSPDSSGGNYFYALPLSIGVSQLIILGVEIKKYRC